MPIEDLVLPTITKVGGWVVIGCNRSVSSFNGFVGPTRICEVGHRGKSGAKRVYNGLISVCFSHTRIQKFWIW